MDAIQTFCIHFERDVLWLRKEGQQGMICIISAWKMHVWYGHYVCQQSTLCNFLDLCCNLGSCDFYEIIIIIIIIIINIIIILLIKIYNISLKCSIIKTIYLIIIMIIMFI